MEKSENIFKKILIKVLYYFLTPIIKSNIFTCRLEEINLEKNFIVVHCHGVEAPIKLKIYELIGDSTILSNFSPKHASWIGYYYGMYYNISSHGKSEVNYNLETSSKTRYSIIMLTRYGTLVYADNVTHDIYSMAPSAIMQDTNLIKKFGPIQACYIGLLSGIYSNKKHSPKADRSYVKLELVK